MIGEGGQTYKYQCCGIVMFMLFMLWYSNTYVFYAVAL